MSLFLDCVEISNHHHICYNYINIVSLKTVMPCVFIFWCCCLFKLISAINYNILKECLLSPTCFSNFISSSFKTVSMHVRCFRTHYFVLDFSKMKIQKNFCNVKVYFFVVKHFLWCKLDCQTFKLPLK